MTDGLDRQRRSRAALLGSLVMVSAGVAVAVGAIPFPWPSVSFWIATTLILLGLMLMSGRRLEAQPTLVIASVEGELSSRIRLMELGLVPGTSVRVVRQSPFGDPIEICLRGYSLSLRRAELANVLVTSGTKEEP